MRCRKCGGGCRPSKFYVGLGMYGSKWVCDKCGLGTYSEAMNAFRNIWETASVSKFFGIVRLSKLEADIAYLDILKEENEWTDKNKCI